MKKTLVCAAALAMLATPAFADQVNEIAISSQFITKVAEFPIGFAGSIPRAPFDPGSRYSNLDGFSGQAQLQPSGVALTKFLSDDINAITPVIMTGQDLTDPNGITGSVLFSMSNGNSVAVAARPRFRFHMNDGTAGGPGTLITGFSATNNLNCNANTTCLFRFAIGTTAAPIVLGQHFWAGVAFDNAGTPFAGGIATATTAQMQNIGQGLSDPPVIGTSLDKDFLSTGSDSGLENSPVGGVRTSPFGANPKANYLWDFTPEPGTLSLLALGALGLIRRRK